MTDDLKSHIHTDLTNTGPGSFKPEAYKPEASRRKAYRLIFRRIMYVDYFLSNEDSD